MSRTDLTLLSIDKQPDAVTFAAVNGEGQPVNLTMPRPVDVQTSFPTEREAGVPVDLYVTREDTAPGLGFAFKVYPETQEGRAVLELLGLAAQVAACSLFSEGVQPSRLIEAAD